MRKYQVGSNSSLKKETLPTFKILQIKISKIENTVPEKIPLWPQVS